MPALSDPVMIRRLLETDRLWSVYALGDLSPEMFRHCAWHCAPDGAPALLLLYRAFATPVIFTLGEASVVGGLLEQVGPPPELYLHVRPEMTPVLRSRYEIPIVKTMWRMILDSKAYRPIMTERVSRLSPHDLPALQRLYADGEPSGEAPDFFASGMLTGGVYFGVREGEDLTAAAGTHLVVPAEGVAAVGNVYTRRDSRGRGLATLVTSAVTAELLRLGLQTIALNVEQHNLPAARVYERLGYVRYCPFHEGLATRRAT
jgi:GNAT superfamily N-acetyltransferase